MVTPRNQLAIYKWISAAKLRQKNGRGQDHYIAQMLDITEVNDNVGDKYADMKRTRRLTHFLWEEEWELEKSVGSGGSAMAQQ